MKKAILGGAWQAKYSFPTAYMLAQLVDHTVGWFLAGLVLARVCRDRA